MAEQPDPAPAPESVAPSADAGHQWSRLSPRMLLVHPVREIVRFVPVLVGLFVAGSGSDGFGRFVGPLLGVLVAIVAGVGRWFTTTYRLTPEAVEVRSGLFSRKQHTAATERVRSVDVTAQPVQRVLGLATVKISTAGQDALDLDGLPAEEAADLRSRLLHHARQLAAEDPTVAPNDVPTGHETPPEEELYRLRPKWALYAPFTLGGLLAAVAVLGFGLNVVVELDLWDSTLSGAVDSVQRWGIAAAVAVLAAVVLVTCVVLSISTYLTSNWGFRVTRDANGRSLHIARGLLTTRSQSLEIARVRGVEVRRGIPSRWVGAASVRAVTSSTDTTDAAATGSHATLCPLSPLPVAEATAAALYPEARTPVESNGTVAVRRRYARAAFGGVLLAAAAVGAGRWFDHLTLGLVGGGVLLVCSVLLGHARARNLGHALTRHHLVSRTGALTVATTLLEQDATVAVATRQTWFQKRAGVCTLQVATAGGGESYRLLDIPTHRAEEIADEVLRTVRESARARRRDGSPVRPNWAATSATASARTG